MSNDFVQAFLDIGLHLNAEKCAWVIDAHSWDRLLDARFAFDDFPKEPVKELKVLGSMFSYDASKLLTVQRRIAQGLKSFAKLQHILLAEGSHDAKFAFWSKIDYLSLAWGCKSEG